MFAWKIVYCHSFSWLCFISLILIFLLVVIGYFATRVRVGGLEEESLSISACLENREHQKYFRNVGCVVTNHNKDDILTGHFRVPKTLTFKMRLGAQPFL